ncbi:MAG: hypothetical protein E6J05_10750 [Chloroflexi bacterium]|nr:MAG: hypothetical protein E6J05_10750 [Chloroflexota bacterium]
MSMPHDPDLEDVLQDQELRRVADLLREARMTEPPLDDAFRSDLRRRLMSQAWGMGGGGTPWWRKVFGPTGMVWATAAVGVILIGAVVVLTATNQPGPSDQVVVSSQLANQSAVRLQQPIQVTFNQPMDHRSTEAAVQIAPATTVAFSWHENTLSVTPTAGNLAPNTQYQVTIGPGAKTASGQSLTAPKTITFVTQPPPPSPSPTPTVKPTPPPTVLTNQHLLASMPDGITNVLWSPDSTTVYFVTGKGALESVPAIGGNPTVLAPDGVGSVAINPAGDQLAYIRKGNIQILAIGQGTTTEVVPAAAPVLVGWATSGVEWATADGVYTVGPGGQGKVAALPATGTATAISFAPDGAHLAYALDQSLSVLDLATGKSTVLGLPGAHFQGWSPDGTGVMYSGAQAVVLADLGGRNTTSLPAGEPSWSSQDEVLLGSDVNLFVMRPDASGQTKLADGTFHLPAWAPNGIAFTYFRSGELYTASAPTPAPPATSPLDAAASVVNLFMKARKDNPDRANAYLDDNGRKAYMSSTGGLNLQVTGDPSFSRYYVLTGQITGSHPDTAQFVVRIVLAHNSLDVKSLEETLTLVRTQGSQQFLVDQAAAGPVLTLGATAEVVSVDVTATSVKVTFDSDLKPETVTAGVIILDSKGKQIGNMPAYAKRTVTVDGLDLKAGKSYKLVVLSTVQDVGGSNIAAEYDLTFSGPADTHGDRHRDTSPSPIPQPSPTATPSS